MKKTVAAALTATAILGASGISFAAVNPFSDVPTGHWAYNSVAKLAAAGVVEGYGNGTYRGDRNITRYEMAQMIAKAMAKNPQGIDRAELDRLIAEFRDELEALDVRVDNLEKYADKVTWHGEVCYHYWNQHDNLIAGYKTINTLHHSQLRLYPIIEINNHWKAKARLTCSTDIKSAASGDVKLTYLFAEGVYDKLKLEVGKILLYSNVDDGLVVDDFFSGARATYGDKFKVMVEAGRWDLKNAEISFLENPSLWFKNDDAANYQAAEISYETKPFYIGAGVHHFNSDAFSNFGGYGEDAKDALIWSVGAKYTFGDAVTFAASYANNNKAEDYKKAYSFSLNYKGANWKVPGSWGVAVAYRHVGHNVSLDPTYNVYCEGRPNKRGVDFKVTYTPVKNTSLQAEYFIGKTLDTEEKTRTLFTRVSWAF
ncbi:MAG: porin [Selenomonadaceae bacterium]|nr:porin [Selenomonadaceae bacterium]